MFFRTNNPIHQENGRMKIPEELLKCTVLFVGLTVKDTNVNIEIDQKGKQKHSIQWCRQNGCTIPTELDGNRISKKSITMHWMFLISGGGGNGAAGNGAGVTTPFNMLMHLLNFTGSTIPWHTWISSLRSSNIEFSPHFRHKIKRFDEDADEASWHTFFVGGTGASMFRFRFKFGRDSFGIKKKNYSFNALLYTFMSRCIE